MVIYQIITSLLVAISCIGYGASLLRLLRVRVGLNFIGRLTLFFAVGMGFSGWLLFFLGVAGALNSAGFTIILVTGLLGVLMFWRDFNPSFTRTGLLGCSILLLTGLIILMDIFEALAPAGEADTLAYHYALIKEFIDAGQVTFEPRAIDGAAPLLIQMTYLTPYFLGGETSLNSWNLICGIAAGGLFYSILRQHLSKNWALVVVMLFLTTPAVIYVSGSGQVEVKNSLFVMLAAFAIERSRSTNNLGYIALAGMAAGYFVGGKYLGLIFAATCGLVILFQSDGIKRAALFAFFAFLTGFQWYLWNWLHTGDPLFPVLYDYIGDKSLQIWSDAHQRNLWTYLKGETGVAVNLANFFAYPVLATFSTEPAFGSLRAGFGPFYLFVLPLSLLGLWLHRRSIFQSKLFTYAVITLIFYFLWFFSGQSQRVRHLLPILPLLLICLSVSALRFSQHVGSFRPLVFAILIALSFQFSVQTLFTFKFIQYAFSNETRDEFLNRTVSWYEPVMWINKNLSSNNKVLHSIRWHNYLLNVPYYWSHWDTQSLVNLLPNQTDTRRFLREIQNLRVTHVLQFPVLMDKVGSKARDDSNKFNYHIRVLAEEKCLLLVKAFNVRRFGSRTLSTSTASHSRTNLYRLSNTGCIKLSTG